MKKHAHDRQEKTATMLTAHSGCNGTPDNSLAFLAYALALPVDALEVDVRRLPDGTLVLAHDEEVEDAPRLADAMTLLARVPGMRINCDMKMPGLEQPVWALAQAHGVSDRLVYSGMVSAAAMAADPSMRHAVMWFYNLELRFPRIEETLQACVSDNRPVEALADEMLRTLHAAGATCLNLNWRLRETPLWQALQDKGIPLSVWTPDNPDLIRQLLDEGVRNITTRNARCAAEIRASWRKG